MGQGRFWASICLSVVVQSAIFVIPAWCVDEKMLVAEVVEKASPAILGTAMMSEDGIITVSLDRVMNGKRAEEVIRYTSADPSYQQVLGHVGGLRPGETKPILAWPPGQ